MGAAAEAVPQGRRNGDLRVRDGDHRGGRGSLLLLYEVVTSGQVKAELQSIVKRALECADVNGARTGGS